MSQEQENNLLFLVITCDFNFFFRIPLSYIVSMAPKRKGNSWP